MKSVVMATLVVGVSVLVARPAAADSCSCSYDGTRPCSASITCATGENANCSCTSGGCSSSCSGAGPGRKLLQVDEFSQFRAFEMTGTLRGFADHVEKLSQGTWTVSFEMDTQPLVLEGEALAPDDGRIGIAGATVQGPELHLTHESLTFANLAKTVAQDFGACAELFPKARLIVFRPSGSCAE